MAAKLCLVTWATEPVSRTVSLKQLASILVDIRAMHERNGMPDWAGRSFEYRAQVSKIMRSAGLSDSDRKKVIGLLRYHVGNELRERVSAEELLKAGLKPESPKQRVLDAKTVNTSVEMAVKRLKDAVETLRGAPYDEISPEHLDAMGEASYYLGEIADEHDTFGR